MGNDKKMSTVHMVLTALMAAVLCVLGPFAVPVGAVPISLTSLVLYFLVYILNGRLALISYAIYFLLGLVGLPVFSGFSGGIGKILGPTGGYLFGFFLMIPLCALAVNRFNKRNILQYVGVVFATLVAYAFGTIWFMASMGCTLGTALTICVVPFIIGDLIKIALAVWLGPILRKRMHMAGV